jgi:hypothetical protein
MFVRKKKNPSGIISIQIIDKSLGKYKVLKTVGSSSDEKDIENLYQQGKKWIEARLCKRDMFLEKTKEQEEKQVTEYLLSNVENILLNGTQLVLNKVFNLVGFDKIDDEILRHLIISRICQPRSKVATVDYLKSYFYPDIELYKIYRYLDKLHDTQREKVQQI